MMRVRTDLMCPDCGSLMKLRGSKFGLFYGCTMYPRCKGTHGAKADTGEPLGTPAPKETRDARIAAHAAFDRLWGRGGVRNTPMTRTQAYEWMREAMGLAKEQAHIGHFTKEQCEQITKKVAAYMATLPQAGNAT